MSRARVYPDEPVGPFPSPPRTITDAEGRSVRIRAVGPAEGALDPDRALDPIVEMYAGFDPADRAQGLPPTGDERIREWVADLLDADAHNVVALVGSAVVGHAVLVPDEDVHELAIFVHHEYQEAGIGTALLRTLLGHAADLGIERVWLTVERWNAPAINLYEKVGFETSSAEGFELEMAIRLRAEGDADADGHPDPEADDANADDGER
ncbi:MAG: N-acetyltransferase family protein [Haloferacaceae archaeon]